MRINTTLGAITIIAILATTLFLAGAALHIYYSNVETVDIGIALTLDSSFIGLTVTLTATLTNGGEAIVGETVSFYLCDSAGLEIDHLGDATTDELGVASHTYTALGNGTYCFIAGYL